MATVIRKIVKGTNDGYVLYDTSSVNIDDVTLMLGYDGYDELSSLCDLWVYFENIPIPFGSEIISCDLQLNAYSVNGGGVATNFYMSLDNKNITSYSDWLAVNKTSNKSPIYLDESADGAIFSVDLQAVMQEKVNNKAWAKDENLLIMTSDTIKDESESYVDVDSYEWEQNALLTIEYIPAEIVTLKDVLLNNRVEQFKYKHFRLESGLLSPVSEDISEDIKSGEIDINFENKIIGQLALETNDNLSLTFNDYVQPYYYISDNFREYEIPLGLYAMKNPKYNFQDVLMLKNNTGYDLTMVLEDDKLTESLTVPKNTIVTDYVNTLISGVGSWIKKNIQSSSETLKEDFSYVTGRSKLFIINSLLNTINYYPVWADGNGVIRSIPWTSEPNITWYFKDDSESLYTGQYNVESDYTNTFNKAVVVANQLTEDTEPLVGVKTFEDIGLTEHPYSYTNLGRYVTKIFQSEATSQTYVDLRAERELKNSLQIEETLSYNHAFVTNKENDGLPFNGDCFKFYHSDYSQNLNSIIYKILSHKYNLEVGSLVSSKIRKFKYFE